MKRNIGSLMRVGAWLGGVVVVVLVVGCSALVLGLLMRDHAQAAFAPISFWRLLPEGLRILAFSLGTALSAELITLPLSVSMAALGSFYLPRRWMGTATNVVNALSSIPAVVFGYMSLSYVVPTIRSPYWAVTLTLALMSVMRQTLALMRVNARHLPAVEAADALGAYFYEIVRGVVLPRAARSYLEVALRMMTRNVTEGVAVLMVLYNYSGSGDTLATAIMKAVGVTGDMGRVQWVLLLAALLALLVVLLNRLISACVQGGQHDKKRA